MKIFFVAIVLLSASFLYAQQPHCYTAEYQQQILKDDPASAVAMAEAELQVQQYLAGHKSERTAEGVETYIIPVVVHIVYRTTVENISNEQVFSQIDVLNEDYMRLNDDAEDTPDEFADDAGVPSIQFVLASFDPDGNPTTGITRTETDITSWNLDASSSATNYAQKVKDADEGGEDGWDRNCYLNIWVCNLSGGVLGFSSIPGGSSSTDGCVIGYKYFGRGGSAASEFDLGRTATHEVGHWLGLFHIWGDDLGSCSGSDGISDTPNQGSENYFTPAFPLTDACSPTFPGVMFMNFMDYVDDAAMNMFTEGQANKMRGVLESTREDLLECTDAFTADVPMYGGNNWMQMHIFPNPTENGAFMIYLNNATVKEIELEIYNTLGEVVYSVHNNAAQTFSLHVDLSALANGAYMIRAYDGMQSITKQLIIAK